MDDNDTKMLEEMRHNLVVLQVNYKRSNILDQALLRPQLDELLTDYARYQTKLIKQGVITTDEDLESMKAIKAEIDAAADKQSMLLAIARTIAFIAVRV